MGTDHMTPAECRWFAKLAGEESVSGQALESCAVTIARLESDLAAAREELAKHKPEEREGVCSCGGCMIEHGGLWAYRRLDTDGIRSIGEPDLLDMDYCPECGDKLDPPQAIRYARRNPDSARVQRVREALDELECCKRFERAFSNYTASERTKCLKVCATIRAALDGEMPT